MTADTRTIAGYPLSLAASVRAVPWKPLWRLRPRIEFQSQLMGMCKVEMPATSWNNHLKKMRSRMARDEEGKSRESSEEGGAAQTAAQGAKANPRQADGLTK